MPSELPEHSKSLLKRDLSAMTGTKAFSKHLLLFLSLEFFFLPPFSSLPAIILHFIYCLSLPGHFLFSSINEPASTGHRVCALKGVGRFKRRYSGKIPALWEVRNSQDTTTTPRKQL